MRPVIKKMILLGLISSLLLSCKEEKSLIYPTIDVVECAKHVWGIWGDGKYYNGLGAIFLHETSHLVPDDVKELKVYRQKVYLLTSVGELKRFDLKTGQEELLYLGKIETFDVDTLQQCIYALDKEQKYLYKYDCMKKDMLSRRSVEVKEYPYDGLACLPGGQILLLINSYPNGMYVLVDYEVGTFHVCSMGYKYKSKYTLLPDTFQLKAYVTGVCEQGVLYKHLLNDTVFVWDKEKFKPYALCCMDGEGVTYQEATFFRDEKLFKRNNMLALTHFDRVNNLWFVGYKSKYERMGKERYNTALALLNEDFSICESNDYIFCLDKKRVVMNRRYPYFVDKERKGVFQIYRKEAHPNHAMGQKVEVFEYLKNHKNPNDLILCYFYF